MNKVGNSARKNFIASGKFDSVKLTLIFIDVFLAVTSCYIYKISCYMSMYYVFFIQIYS